MKILIAEDDALILKTLELCLAKNTVEIISCMDGLDAMEKIKLCEPDIIILDVMLPSLSGIEILRKVKQKDNPIPVIMISSTEQQSVIDEAMHLGVDEYIAKPFNINTLTSHIKRLTSKQATLLFDSKVSPQQLLYDRLLTSIC